MYVPDKFPPYTETGHLFINSFLNKETNETTMLHLYNPCIELIRLEDKLEIKVILCAGIVGFLNKGFVNTNIRSASEEFKNIPLEFYRNYRKDQWFYKENTAGFFSTPDFFYCKFEIDTNNDPYFNREILNESINMEMSFWGDGNRMKKEMFWNPDTDRNVDAFVKELPSIKVPLSFNFSNTMYFQNEMKIPTAERYTDNELYAEYYYGLNAEIKQRDDSFIRSVFDFQPISTTKVYIRGYDIELSPRNTTEKIKIKNRISREVKNSIDIMEGYDFNPVTNKFESTEKFKGINYPYQSDIDMKANVYIKVGNTNMKIIVNKPIIQTKFDLSKIQCKKGEIIDEIEYKAI